MLAVQLREHLCQSPADVILHFHEWLSLGSLKLHQAFVLEAKKKATDEVQHTCVRQSQETATLNEEERSIGSIC